MNICTEHKNDGKGRCLNCGAYLPDPEIAAQWAEDDRAKLELCDRLDECANRARDGKVPTEQEIEDMNEAAELIRLTVE